MGLRRNSTFYWRDQTHTAGVSSRLLASRGVTVELVRPAILRGNEMPGLQLLVQTAFAETACAWSWPALTLTLTLQWSMIRR